MFLSFFKKRDKNHAFVQLTLKIVIAKFCFFWGGASALIRYAVLAGRPTQCVPSSTLPELKSLWRRCVVLVTKKNK